MNSYRLQLHLKIGLLSLLQSLVEAPLSPSNYGTNPSPATTAGISFPHRHSTLSLAIDILHSPFTIQGKKSVPLERDGCCDLWAAESGRVSGMGVSERGLLRKAGANRRRHLRVSFCPSLIDER